SGLVSSARFSPDGSRIVSTSEDRTARLWDAASGDPLIELRGHDDFVSSACFSPDGRRLLTSSWDATIRVMDPRAEPPRRIAHSPR
ncbi:MAG: PD40 domain-containing protein, partial [Phycisphaerales bacterium]|nr:PD40 domain-containing protein [Phycisphaerales bacterium]